MSRVIRYDMIVELLKLSPTEKQLLGDRMHVVMPIMRIFPGPAPTPAIAYARSLYEQTGRRQWVFAPGMARRRANA